MSSISGTGLDVQGLVSQLMYVEREPIRQLQTQRATLQSQKQAFETVNSNLAGVYSAIEGLRSSSDFGAKSATSSDTAYLTATASSEAVAGVYNFKVTNLATTATEATSTYHATTSESFAAEGTLSIAVGSGAAVTVDVSAASNTNTLEGLKSAINSSGADVTASIIQDKSGYRLMLSSNSSGTAGNVTFSSTTTALQTELFGSSSPVSAVAEDAAFTVNEISFTSSSNTVSDAVEGLTVNLLDEGTKNISVTVAEDTSKVQAAVESFVANYNTLTSFLNAQFTYSTDQTENPPLAGNSDLRRIQSDILGLVSSSVSGLDQELRNLSQIGIEMNNDGTLTVDDEKLTTALEDDFDQVRNLFQTYGSSSDTHLKFVSSGSSTQAGSYSVSVSSAAAQASASSTYATPLTQAETLKVLLNSSSFSVTLSAGASLSSIISTINSEAQNQGVGVRAVDGGSSLLKIFSLEYGSSQQLSFTETDPDYPETALNQLGLNSTSVTGLDVIGTINGATATGSGKYLTGATGDAADGLTVEVSPSQELNTPTTFSFSKGYATLLSDKLDYFTNTLNGPVILAQNGLDRMMADMDDRMLQMENRLQTVEDMYMKQFTAADESLRKMSTAMAALNKQTSFF